MFKETIHIGALSYIFNVWLHVLVLWEALSSAEMLLIFTSFFLIVSLIRYICSLLFTA